MPKTAPLSNADRSASRQSAQTSPALMTAFLKEHLGPKLLASTVGTTSRTLGNWISGVPPRLDHERRLRACYQVFRVLESVEQAPTIRAWFMGMNPQLSDQSPAEALLGDRYQEVMTAARAFVAGG